MQPTCLENRKTNCDLYDGFAASAAICYAVYSSTGGSVLVHVLTSSIMAVEECYASSLTKDPESSDCSDVFR
nr:hypothetical protein CFP56_62688 [Quercus suber]